jgi:hypothetical protein
VRRTRDALSAPNLQVVGTSATLAGEGAFDEQQAGVAAVASRLFGAPVRPEDVIGETLQRATVPYDSNDTDFVRALAARVADAAAQPPHDYQDFVADPRSGQ